MKGIFKKVNAKTLIIVGFICVLVLSLVSCDRQKSSGAGYKERFKEIVDGRYEKELVPDFAPDSVSAVYGVSVDGELWGKIVVVEKQGYEGTVKIAVGINLDATTEKVIILQEKESHNKNLQSLLDSLSDNVSEDEIDSVEIVSGASVSSATIKSAVKDAFLGAGIVKIGEPNDNNGNETNDSNDGAADEDEGAAAPAPSEELPSSEEDIILWAEEMVASGAGLVNVTPTGYNECLKRVYRDKGGRGYVAYLVVTSERYNRVETETLVYVGNDGRIKNVKRIVFKTSDAGWGYVPPEESAVEVFYARLVGKDLSDLQAIYSGAGGGETLVTGATSTSGSLVNSLIVGVSAIYSLQSK